MSRKAIIFIALSIFTTAASSRSGAGTLDPAHVPADAKWVIHVDFESFSDSDFAKAARQQKPQMAKGVRDWIEKRYVIDPPEDLHSATAFSRDYRVHTGTVILHANYDKAKVEATLKHAMNHRTDQWEGHTLHTVTLSKQEPGEGGPSGDEEMTVVMLDSDTIIFGSSNANAKDAIKLLQGDAETLEGTDTPLITGAAKSAWMYGAAIDLQQLKDHPVSMPILSQHKQIVWSFGERDGQIYEQGDFLAASEQIAESTKKILDGIVAYESLWSEGSEPMKAVMKSVQVSREGNRSSLRWQGDSDTVVNALDDALDQMATWRPFLVSEHGEKNMRKAAK